MIGDLLRRMNQRRKLRRGQCVNCRVPLRDDEKTPFCSRECGEEWLDRTAT